MIKISDINAAAHRIRDYVATTPTVESDGLSDYLGRTIVLKLENLQRGGSFKPRGVLNKLLSLHSERIHQKIVAVSGGNFGIALAEIGKLLGMEITIVLPASAPETSAEKITRFDAQVIWTPTVKEAFSIADQLASDGVYLIDDCDDPLIASGSGTLALEMHESRSDITDVFVSIGGGSMISGVATALMDRNSAIRVWGVETKGADSMSCAVKQGKPVEIEITSKVSTLGVPIVSNFFLEHVLKLVHEVVVVSDQQAFSGVVDFAERAGVWTEPAAGSLIAAMRNVADRIPKNAVVGLVVCGGNASLGSIVSETDF